MKKSLLIFGIATASLFTFSCTKDEVTENTPGTCDTDYTYNADIASIITDNCAGCHKAGGPSPLLTTYAEVVSSLTRVKVRAVDLKTMPQGGPLSDADIQKLSCWIEQGNPEN